MNEKYENLCKELYVSMSFMDIVAFELFANENHEIDINIYKKCITPELIENTIYDTLLDKFWNAYERRVDINDMIFNFCDYELFLDIIKSRYKSYIREEQINSIFED